MRKTVVGILLLIMSGCDVQYPNAPQTFDLIQSKKTTPVGVAATMDERENEKIGIIDGSSIEVRKHDLVELVSDYLIRCINEKAGLIVERVQISDADSIKLIATKNKVKAVIILRIKSLKVFSLESLHLPIQTELVLELSVFDETAQEIYRRSVTSHSENSKSSVIEKTINELLESVVKDGLRQYGRDRDLKKIIAKFKYGAVGGALSQIF